MLRHEKIVGIISSYDIRWKESSGFSLIVTDSRLVGVPHGDFAEDYSVYFAPGTDPDPALYREAVERAGDMILHKSFELERTEIVQIAYDPPGQLFGGRLLITVMGRRFEIKISVLSGWNPRIQKALDALVESLVFFSPLQFYDERTGHRIENRARASPSSSTTAGAPVSTLS